MAITLFAGSRQLAIGPTTLHEAVSFGRTTRTSRMPFDTVLHHQHEQPTKALSGGSLTSLTFAGCRCPTWFIRVMAGIVTRGTPYSATRSMSWIRHSPLIYSVTTHDLRRGQSHDCNPQLAYPFDAYVIF